VAVSEWEQNVRTGEKYEGGLTVWRLYVYPFYDTLTQLLCAEPGRAGGWHVTADALTLGKAILEQVVQLRPLNQVRRKDGPEKPFWGPRIIACRSISGTRACIELVAAEMVVGDLGWDAQAWERWPCYGCSRRSAGRKVSWSGRCRAEPRSARRQLAGPGKASRRSAGRQWAAVLPEA
jgi:hypothetical protein